MFHGRALCLLILDRVVQPMQKPIDGGKVRHGSLLFGKCDRSGYTELFSKGGSSIILPTTCKTWGCVICRTKLIGLFKARVEIGVSTLGLCGFITTTYQADNAAHRDAASVAKDWAALWRRLRRKGRRWKWLKVTELTKRGIPHHHIVLGPLDPKLTVRCHGRTIKKGRETQIYLRRMGTCACLAHIFAREWREITNDSFMCFATPVTDPEGAGSYMGKYMSKQFLEEHREGRRFSTSRDWPGGKRMRLRVTEEEGWAYIRRWGAAWFTSTDDLNAVEKEREPWLLDRVGDDLTKHILMRNSKRAAERQFRKVLGR